MRMETPLDYVGICRHHHASALKLAGAAAKRVAAGGAGARGTGVLLTRHWRRLFVTRKITHIYDL